MRYIILFLPLILLGGCYSYGYYPYGYGYPPGYAAGYHPYPSSAPPPTYPPHPPNYVSQRSPAPSPGENCGTPDQFKPCPPLPRHPLPYYPANRY